MFIANTLLLEWSHVGQSSTSINKYSEKINEKRYFITTTTKKNPNPSMLACVE